MWALSDPTRFLHLPYALEVSLTTRAAGVADSSPMAGGHYITRLARSYGLLTAEITTTLTTTPPARTSGPQAQPEPEQPARRRRRREEPPAYPPVQPQPQLAELQAAMRAIERRMMYAKAHHRWVAETQRLIMLQLRIDDIPAYPPSDPDDEAGPFGTHHDDDD
ncbi:hypothetical protein L2E82_45460 [Cichorium intybus]|uniref:Uncharacterized protein n=1 Tax=Cichorium intybus TaxID=13427 RepID=A0ACB8ZS34_CICIN|nr:hypothetical protein L2E82_45460 [Cichorium intybus]